MFKKEGAGAGEGIAGEGVAWGFQHKDSHQKDADSVSQTQAQCESRKGSRDVMGKHGTEANNIPRATPRSDPRGTRDTPESTHKDSNTLQMPRDSREMDAMGTVDAVSAPISDKLAAWRVVGPCWVDSV